MGPKLERLVLADDDMVAAVVAWSAIDHATEHRPDLERWSDELWYCPRQWMRAAGLRTARAQQLAERLRVLGFISPEGKPWEPVLQLAQAMASKRLKRR